ncbi:hypothetical protein [Streptomyces sp. NPDC002676]
MSDRKAVTGDDRLPEPDQSKLPLSPDEIRKHDILPGFEGDYHAPPADSAKDPLDRPPLQPDPPGLIKPPGKSGGSGDRLKIAPSVLKTAAGHVDDIYDDFYKPAATLEEPSLKAVRELAGMESAPAIRLAHRQWERQAGTVTAWLAHIAESLRSTDHTYKSTDASVEESARQVKVRSVLEDY